jgi:hypothetical protein
MILPLATCPYCERGDVAFDVAGHEVVFNPGTTAQPAGIPCEHVVCVDGYATEWDQLSDGSTRAHGNSFWWLCPGLDRAYCELELSDYLCDFVYANHPWMYAPPANYSVEDFFIEEERDLTDSEVQMIKAHIHPLRLPDDDLTTNDVSLWGVVVFAADPAAFLNALPSCHEMWLANLGGGQSRSPDASE